MAMHTNKKSRKKTPQKQAMHKGYMPHEKNKMAAFIFQFSDIALGYNNAE